MEKEFYNLLMVIIMKENLLIIGIKVLVFTLGQMVDIIKDNGLKENSMEKEYTKMRIMK